MAQRRNLCFFETVYIQRQVSHQVLEIGVIALQLIDLLPRGVSDRIPCQPFLPGLDKVLGPSIVGSRFDAFTAT